MVHFRDATHRQYRRTGNINMVNDGQPKLEMLMVEADGTIDPKTPVSKPITNVTEAIAYPVETRRLTVTGGTFITLPTSEIAELWHKWNYYHRGISLTRSNVLLIGLTHDLIGKQVFGMCPYGDFVKIRHVSGVTLVDCTFFSHRKTTHGTYDIGVGHSVDVRFYNCRESTDIHDRDNWPCFGSNYCRDILFDHCEFWRFDAHCGVHNATIRNSRLGTISPIGTGTLLVENTSVEGFTTDKGGVFIHIRADYGSNWDGDIVIRNCTLALSATDKRSCSFICANNNGTHDYGYPCRMGRKIVVDGLMIDDLDAKGKPCPCTLFCEGSGEKAGQPRISPYNPPEEIVLRNVRTASGAQPKLFNREKFFEKTKLVEE